MKTTFDIIQDITFDKPNYTLLQSDECSPYMIQRWLSFIDPAYANLLNEIYNIRSEGFTDNQQFYDFLKCIIPKKRVGKINYIKKSKINQTSKNVEIIKEIADNLEISQKEAEDIISVYPNIIKLYKDESKILQKID